jgi:hypothetical protein
VNPDAPRSSAYRTAEHAVGGDLEAWLRDRRDKGDSFNSIAGELRDLHVIVTAQGVHGWCDRLHIDGGRKAS